MQNKLYYVHHNRVYFALLLTVCKYVSIGYDIFWTYGQPKMIALLIKSKQGDGIVSGFIDCPINNFEYFFLNTRKTDFFSREIFCGSA